MGVGEGGGPIHPLSGILGSAKKPKFYPCDLNVIRVGIGQL